MHNPQLCPIAAGVLASAPCSLEMPAGTGKTHLLAACAATAAGRGERSLILTHTNAGVDAVRKRLRSLDVPSRAARVETITSWAFLLARSYSGIAGLTVPAAPDWNCSRDYVDGATLVASTAAVRRMHEVSFGYLLVDEYQDCTVDQHKLVLAISDAVPRSVLFGDRLQAIFGFDASRPLIDWDVHVTPRFTQRTVPHVPHRWRDHNPDLGQWLLDIRPSLVDGGTFDFTAHEISGIRWQQCDDKTAARTVIGASNGLAKSTESVVLLDKWAHDVAQHASRLGGTYAVMEDVGGRFMADQLDKLPAESDLSLALWLARMAKDCFVGLAGLDARILGKLEGGKKVSHLKREGLAQVQAALDRVLDNPTYSQLQLSASDIRATPSLNLYRREAWDDTFRAIACSAEDGISLREGLAAVRDRLRRGGRGNRRLIASRTLLVKGLEFDHVIIANAQNFTDPRQLYVALSRARKSATVIGKSPRLSLRDE